MESNNMINYKTKLNTGRQGTTTPKVSKYNSDQAVLSDRSRIINSPAFRRLQQKAQLFPLEINAAVRSRLTHSLEVQLGGRYIAEKILNKMMQAGLKKYDIDGLENVFISLVEMSCLLHDIGNPPFGHIAEKVISNWSSDNIIPLFEKLYKDKVPHDLYNQITSDISIFEGNAQAIRTVISIQRMNLTFPLIASLLKYTIGAFEMKDNKVFNHIHKKPGYYLSEKESVENVWSVLEINNGSRHPLAYVMEASDDISYCVADIDDAIDKGILTVDRLNTELRSIWNDKKDILPEQDRDYLINILNKVFDNKNDYYIMLNLRVQLQTDLVDYVADRYLDNHEAVFNGDFDSPLIDGESKYAVALECLRSITTKFVFSHKDVEALELKGNAVLKGLLDIYKPILELTGDEFSSLYKDNRLSSKPIETMLYHKLSGKSKNTYQIAVLSMPGELDSKMKECFELYHRCRLLLDNIGGMTDMYAQEEYKHLSGII